MCLPCRSNRFLLTYPDFKYGRLQFCTLRPPHQVHKAYQLPPIHCCFIIRRLALAKQGDIRFGSIYLFDNFYGLLKFGAKSDYYQSLPSPPITA